MSTEIPVANRQVCLDSSGPSVSIDNQNENIMTTTGTPAADAQADAHIDTTVTDAATDEEVDKTKIVSPIPEIILHVSSFVPQSPSDLENSDLTASEIEVILSRTAAASSLHSHTAGKVGDESDEAQKEGGNVESNDESDADDGCVFESVKLVSYHIDADMLVRVREPAGFTMYEVCSDLVAAASPAWRRIIENDVMIPDNTSDSHAVLHLPCSADYAFGLDLMFSIIHYKFYDFPDRPDVDQLYSVARVVETYHCAHLFVPYMEKWLVRLNWHIVMKTSQNDEKILHATWVFGDASWFTRIVSKAAHKATLNDEEVLVDTHGKAWKDHGLSQTVADMIADLRKDCLVKIVKTVNNPVEELMVDGRERTMKFCRCKNASIDDKESCQLMQLGSMVSGLRAAGLLPFPKINEYRGSVADLAEKALGVKVVHFRVAGTLPHLDGHMNCGVALKEGLTRIMEENAQLSGHIVRQLRERAIRIGAFKDEISRDVNSPDMALLRILQHDPVQFKQVRTVFAHHLGPIHGNSEEDVNSEKLEA